MFLHLEMAFTLLQCGLTNTIAYNWMKVFTLKLFFKQGLTLENEYNAL